MNKISLSVHQLVDFCLRTGDIDARFFNVTTMKEGTKLHAIYQNKQDENYHKEVPLKIHFRYKNFDITLNGIADGIILNENETIIDEIKTTNDTLENFFNENEDWHLGQAICYAFMLSKENDIDKIKISLTYISQIDGSSVKKFYEFTKEEVELKVYSFFDIYLKFENILNRHKDERDNSLHTSNFPYKNIREGQDKLIELTENAIKNKEYVFCEASTGIGKTISTIYGTLDALKTGKIDKVFYLTAKNSGFINSKSALDLLIDQGNSLNYVEIVSKEKMCPYNKTKNCNPDSCPLADKYYSKLKNCLEDVLMNNKKLTTELIKKYAKMHHICPFELSLDLSLYADFIICDYNYAFHPISYLKRFFENPDKQYRLFALVDESHNLINRSKDMYSATLTSESFEKAKKILKEVVYKKMKACLAKVTTIFNTFKKFNFDEKNAYVIEDFDPDYYDKLKALDDAYGDYLESHPDFKSKEVEDYFLENYKFLRIYELASKENHILFVQKEENGISLHAYCLDASPFIREAIYKFEGAVFFSATLAPIDYYKNSILGYDTYKDLTIDSPFDKNNFKVFVNNKLSIKYKDRMKTLSEVIDEIRVFTSGKIGNYLIFAPSFEYLDFIKHRFKDDERFIFQERTMNNEYKSAFLDEFVEEPLETRIGVCVLGGTFSEGIDLVGSRLYGVIVIGVGMPTISFENDLTTAFYKEKEMNGFEYVYVNPGINKVMQALGRVIRSENDKGIALLIDNRYLYKNYRTTILSRYSNYKVIGSAIELQNELELLE